MVLCAERVKGITAVRGVLVVDDENLVRRVISRRLQMENFRVWEARNGAEAVELFRVFRDDIDAVLLDVHMPGLDGPATLHAIRELRPDVFAYFLTGYCDDYGDAELEAAGARRVFLKAGIDWDELVQLLQA